MCSTCVEEHSEICPACRIEFSIKPEKYVDKKRLLIVFFFGLIGLIITYLFLLIKYDDDALSYLFPQGFVYFFLGISAGYTFYLYEDKETFKWINNIPFIGFKLILLIGVLTIVSFIPALIYLSKVYIYLTTSKNGE